MATNIEELLDRARTVQMTSEQKESQRRSFAYGNGNIENPRISRESIAQEAERLTKADEQKH